MGLLIKGKWKDKWYEPDADGKFVRPETQFRNRLSTDGSAAFSPEAGRYHLYISRACPWAHRTVILRKLKGLEAVIGMSIVDPYMGKLGWVFSNGDDCIPDNVNGKNYLYEIYRLAEPKYTGFVTVPTLWDKQQNTIMNNESREIIRMFDLEFEGVAENQVTFCPNDLRAEIDKMIDANYEPVNNGVYRTGFATTQNAYDEAVSQLFKRLDELDALLASSRYLCGEVLTEADWCLFPTLIRFDLVYVTHFKCNIRRVQDYPNLWNYVKELYQIPGIRETCNFDHMKNHYFGSHESINPSRIIPKGPVIDFDAPHDRNRLPKAE